MDPITIEKLQAMKNARSKKTIQLLHSLLKFILTILFLGLFLSSPLWLRLVFSFLKILVSMIFDAKCLFIVCNIIIVILLGQSKISLTTSNSPAFDIYEEYVSRNKSLRNVSSTSGKHAVEDRHEVIDEEEEEEEGDHHHKGLDELNKRVEDFIARVNKQRRTEARMSVFCE